MKMPVASASTSEIVDIWDHNMETEFARLRELVVDYPFVAMDTEYPGIVARPYGEFKHSQDFQYQTIKMNIDLLKIIQIGITLFNDQGQTPPGAHSFQFNFRFCLKGDMFAKESIDMLVTAGIQFDEHEKRGIEPIHFAELLISSGLVLTNDVRWITFHGSYDFAYLLKVLTCTKLPDEENTFMSDYRMFFPMAYDVKYLMKSVKHLKGGLADVATQLEVSRVGPQHQAGSDSLLTGRCFFRLKENYFDQYIDDNKYCGCIIGFSNPTPNGSTAQAGNADDKP